MTKRINSLVKRLRENDSIRDYGLSKEILLLVLNRSFELNVSDKCFCVVLSTIYYCSRQSSDNWLRYVTSYDQYNDSHIMRSNSMLSESTNYPKYLFSTIVDNKYLLMWMKGESPISGLRCIWRSIGGKMLSFALITRAVAALLDLLRYGMNPISDHWGLCNTSLESWVCKFVDWMWEYSKDDMIYLIPTHPSYVWNKH